MGITMSAPVETLTSPAFDTGIRRLRWTTKEFHRACAMQLFDRPERLELLQGEIYEKMSEDPSHSTGVDLTLDLLIQAFTGKTWCLRVQHPITMPADSEPEPDIVVAVGTRRRYAEQHPQPADIALLVEVANTTLLYDRQRKAPAYAEAGIAEYWILNVTGRQLEVYRVPEGGIYQQIWILSETQTVSPLNAPQISLAVRDFLP